MEASNTSVSPKDVKSVTQIGKDDSETIGSVSEHVGLITSQFCNPEVSDVVLKVGESSFQCNKFFLAMYSEVFKTMLTDEKWTDSKKCEITLEEDADCMAVFGEFLRYMYSGTITLTTDVTLPILVLADKYDVRVLKKACEDYVKRRVKMGGNTASAIKWLSKARHYSLGALSTQCLDIIGLKLQEVFDKFHQDWEAFDFDVVFQILQNSNVGVNDELALFKQLEKWLVNETRVEQLDENIAKLGPLVRFSQMTPLQLHEVETSDLVGRSGSHLTEYISEAYKYHLLNKQLGIFNAEKFSTRIYLHQIAQLDGPGLRIVKWKALPSRERGQAKFNCAVLSANGAKTESWGLEVFQQSPPKTGGDDSFPKRNITFLLYPNRAHATKSYKTRVVLIDGRQNDGYQAYRCEIFDGCLDGDSSSTNYPYLKSQISVTIDDVILRDELQFLMDIQVR